MSDAKTLHRAAHIVVSDKNTDIVKAFTSTARRHVDERRDIVFGKHNPETDISYPPPYSE
jgi:hypothetical protein